MMVEQETLPSSSHAEGGDRVGPTEYTTTIIRSDDRKESLHFSPGLESAWVLVMDHRVPTGCQIKLDVASARALRDALTAYIDRVEKAS